MYRKTKNTKTLLYAAAVSIIITAMVVLGREMQVVHYLLASSGLLFFGKKLVASFTKEET